MAFDRDNRGGTRRSRYTPTPIGSSSTFGASYHRRAITEHRTNNTYERRLSTNDRTEARSTSERRYRASGNNAAVPQLRTSRNTRRAPRARSTSRTPLSGVLQVLGWLPRTIAHALGSLIARLPKRVLAGGVVGIVAAVALVVGVSSLVTRCSRDAQDEQVAVSPYTLVATLGEQAGTNTTPVLEQASISSLQTAAWATLHQDELVSWIAAHASSCDTYAGLDAYSSYHALALSCRVPQTTHFVYSLGKSVNGDTGSAAAATPYVDPTTGCTTTALPYTGTVTKGTAPVLYQWDERWGSYGYCGHPLGFTGCGVTVASMAYMGLTGKTDFTPAQMAALAEELGEASSGTNATFFTNDEMETATGLTGTQIYDTADALLAALKDNKFVAISVRANTLASGGHWVLAVSAGSDGTVRINDPNSPTNTARTWTASELVDYANSMYALGVAS